MTASEGDSTSLSLDLLVAFYFSCRGTASCTLLFQSCMMGMLPVKHGFPSFISVVETCVPLPYSGDVILFHVDIYSVCDVF